MVDIYIPTKELVVPQRLKVGVSAYISWQVCKVGTNKVVREAGPYKNLITDSGLDRWRGDEEWSINRLVQRCVVGTGSAEPSPTDVGLVSQVGVSGAYEVVDYGSQGDTLPYYGWVRLQFEFGAGVAQGNLGELGFRSAAAGSPLFSRQLFRDEFGQPTTVTVLSDEFLRVTYEVRKYLPNPVDNIQDPVTISGVDHTVTTRPACFGVLAAAWGYEDVFHNFFSSPDPGVLRFGVSTSSDMLPITELLQASGQADSSSRNAYSPGSFTRSFEALWNPGSRTGDVGRVAWGALASTGVSTRAQWQTGFNPPIQKSADDRLILQFYAEWGRA